MLLWLVAMISEMIRQLYERTYPHCKVEAGQPPDLFVCLFVWLLLFLFFMRSKQVAQILRVLFVIDNMGPYSFLCSCPLSTSPHVWCRWSTIWERLASQATGSTSRPDSTSGSSVTLYLRGNMQTLLNLWTLNLLPSFLR